MGKNLNLVNQIVNQQTANPTDINGNANIVNATTDFNGYANFSLGSVMKSRGIQQMAGAYTNLLNSTLFNGGITTTADINVNGNIKMLGTSKIELNNGTIISQSSLQNINSIGKNILNIASNLTQINTIINNINTLNSNVSTLTT
jgi:hypothetical protein